VINDFLPGKRFDRTIVFITLFLALEGLLLIYSASYPLDSGFFSSSFGRQIVWLVIACAAGFSAAKIKIADLNTAAYAIYVFTVLLLIVPLIAGSGEVNRWINIGWFNFQPSEFAKFSAIIVLAKFLSENRRMSEWKRFLLSFVIILPFILLIVREPDMGTAIIFVILWIVMSIWSGISVNKVLAVFLPGLALVSGFYLPLFAAVLTGIGIWAVFWMKKWWKALFYSVFCAAGGFYSGFFWSKLAEYQKERILIFFGLKQDPHGSAYQVIQSKVAIGSGGIFGKGFLHGSQSQLRFLPEQHTDFIVSVLGEEFGFLGITVVFLLYFILIISLLRIARSSEDRFNSMIVAGISGLIFFQVVVNTGMASGIVPVTGMVLPFLSYGGSSLIVMFILMGLASNISMKRFTY